MYVPVDLKVFVGVGPAHIGSGIKKSRMIFILDDHKSRVEMPNILFSNLNHYRPTTVQRVTIDVLYPSFRRMIYAMRRERRVVFRDLEKC